MYRFRKIRSYYQFPSWLKWILISISVLIIAFFIYSIYLYNTIQTSKETGLDESKAYAKDELNMKNITSIDRFQEEIQYHVIMGEMNDNEGVIAFIPIDDNKEPIIIKQEDALSKSEIKSNWQTNCKNCELIKISPAMLDDEPLWEITFIDEKERYVLDYVSFDDGSSYEQLQFKQRSQ